MPIDRWTAPEEENSFLGHGGGLTVWDGKNTETKRPNEIHYETRSGDLAFIDRYVSCSTFRFVSFRFNKYAASSGRIWLLTNLDFIFIFAIFLPPQCGVASSRSDLEGNAVGPSNFLRRFNENRSYREGGGGRRRREMTVDLFCNCSGSGMYVEPSPIQYACH